MAREDYNGLALEENESVVLGPDGEPVTMEEFRKENYLQSADEVLTFKLTTGRDWEPKENKDGGITIRTKPDPGVSVIQKGGSYYFTLNVYLPDTHVYRAFKVEGEREDMAAFLFRLVCDLDGAFEGIEGVHDFDGKLGFEDEKAMVEKVVDALVENKGPSGVEKPAIAE